jgi:hypothetical protein
MTESGLIRAYRIVVSVFVYIVFAILGLSALSAVGDVRGWLVFPVALIGIGLFSVGLAAAGFEASTPRVRK